MCAPILYYSVAKFTKSRLASDRIPNPCSVLVGHVGEQLSAAQGSHLQDIILYGLNCIKVISYSGSKTS